jgi:serine/threonine-protein kinase
MVGLDFRNYTLLGKLGSGGMGEVYLAEHTHLGRKVALKVLQPALSAHTDAVARFFAEARATAQLQNPHIVQIYDCDLHPDGRAYLAMEYLGGETLAQRLARGPLAPDYAGIARIGVQIAAGLAAAHAQGIVHRDLKPANIFLCSDPLGGAESVVKILDFGLAKLVDETRGPSPTQTRSGEIVGTPAYMSPEQCSGRGQVSARADLYSFGCILFEMVCGRLPFVCDGVGEYISAHLREPPVDPSSIQPSLPPRLRALIRSMLAKDPARRPSSAADVGAALQALAQMAPSALRREPRRPPRALWAALVLAVAVPGALAARAWRPRAAGRAAPAVATHRPHGPVIQPVEPAVSATTASAIAVPPPAPPPSTRPPTAARKRTRYDRPPVVAPATKPPVVYRPLDD